MNKTALVTGSSRGIGRAIAEYFGKNGYNVVVNYIKNAEKARETVDIINGYSRAIAVQADVSKEEDVKRMLDKAKLEFGKIDVIVNNAGICHYELTDMTTADTFGRIHDVNVRGIHNVVKNILPHMLSKGEGNIINIASIWGVKGSSMEAAYSASKFAVVGYTNALAREVGRSGIRVNSISPGVIATDMLRGINEETIESLREEIALGRIGEPEDIAKVAYFLASDMSAYVTGQNIVVDGGFI